MHSSQYNVSGIAVKCLLHATRYRNILVDLKINKSRMHTLDLILQSSYWNIAYYLSLYRTFGNKFISLIHVFLGNYLYIYIYLYIYSHIYLFIISLSQVASEPNMQGIFPKTQGQLGRLAMVMHVMYTSIRHIRDNSADKTIGRDIAEFTMVRAVALIRLCIAQKLALMPESQSIKTPKSDLSDQDGTEKESFISQHAYLIKKYIGMGRSERVTSLGRNSFHAIKLRRHQVAISRHIMSQRPHPSWNHWTALVSQKHRGEERPLRTIHDIPQCTKLLLNSVDITQQLFQSQRPMVQDNSSISETRIYYLD